MKKLLLFATIAFATLACSNKNSYTVNGNVEHGDLNGKTVFLGKLVNQQSITIDSAVVAEGKFIFKGKVENPEIYYIQIPNHSVGPFILENTKINVTVYQGYYDISGTELNSLITDFVKQRTDIRRQEKDVFDRYEKAQADGTLTEELNNLLDTEYYAIQAELKNLIFEFLKTNINNKAGECFLGMIDQLETEQMEKLLALTNEKTMNNEKFKEVAERVKMIKAVAIGQPFVDIEMPNPKDEIIKLSDYASKGKYVLIDFWASWCGPCREEMPVLVEVYAKYKNKNFEIVGVSFDRDKEKWINGIAELNMNWVQMSDIKYWQSEGAKLYNVRGIPHTVLIDPQGIIIEKNLRGTALKKKLEELIK